LEAAMAHLHHKVQHQPIGFELLPEEFTLAQLQHLYETILNTAFDKGNFRKKMLSMNVLIPLDKTQKEVRHRPARLFRFDPERYEQLVQKGFLFEL
jgi:8-oxo-dGTP diphosphatase